MKIIHLHCAYVIMAKLVNGVAAKIKEERQENMVISGTALHVISAVVLMVKLKCYGIIVTQKKNQVKYQNELCGENFKY